MHLTLDDLMSIDGLFVGMLSDVERDELSRLIAAGEARIDYEGAAGLLGLGKVKLVPATPAPERERDNG